MPNSLTRHFQEYWPAVSVQPPVTRQKIPYSFDHGHGKDNQTPQCQLSAQGLTLHSRQKRSTTHWLTANPLHQMLWSMCFTGVAARSLVLCSYQIETKCPTSENPRLLQTVPTSLSMEVTSILHETQHRSGSCTPRKVIQPSEQQYLPQPVHPGDNLRLKVPAGSIHGYAVTQCISHEDRSSLKFFAYFDVYVKK